MAWSAIAVLTVSGCGFSAEKLEFDRGSRAESTKAWPAAITHYQAVVDRWTNTERALEAARKASRIAHYETKDFPLAIRLYKHIVLYSKSPEARGAAQRKIAELYLENVMDYENAIVEYQRLLDLPHDKAEEADFRLALARSYFYRSEFFQAQTEIDQLLKSDPDPGRAYDALLLRSNICRTTKKPDEAIKALTEMMQRFPQRSREETIGLLIAVSYEEQKNFPKAIETLQSIKDEYPHKEFIDRRIKALRERQSMLPGAKGLKK